MRGNTIGGNGIIHLSSFFSKTTCLRQLSLEWNEIGKSVQSLEILCSALAENVSIVSLDLKNNCITEAGAGALSSLIRTNNTLERIDLSWNEIKTEGAKTLIPALERNNSITEFEISGNKIDDDVMNIIEELVERNRLGIKKQFQESPRKQIDFPLEDRDEVLDDRERELMAFKGQYDAHFIAHENTARKLEDTEKLLSKEREKESQTRQVLIKRMDLEKEQRDKILNETNKLKDKYMKSELKYKKQIQEFELQIVNLENECSSLNVFLY